MNFGLQLALGQVEGVGFDLLGLNGGREPETVEAALGVYVPLLLPEGDAAATTALLLPMATNPHLAERLNASTPNQTAEMPGGSADLSGLASGVSSAAVSSPVNPSSLARTVGVILGAPAFQRR